MGHMGDVFREMFCSDAVFLLQSPVSSLSRHDLQHLWPVILIFRTEAGFCTVKRRHHHFCLNVLCHWLKYVWHCYSKFQLWLLKRAPKRVLSGWEAWASLWGEEVGAQWSSWQCLEAEGELPHCMSVLLFLQKAGEAARAMCSLFFSWRANGELLCMNWSSQSETIGWTWEWTEDLSASPHSSCSAALYIILRELSARIVLHSERGDCFT